MRTRLIGLIGLVLGFVSPQAFADELKSAATKVTECRSITDDVLRLACLDAAALALSDVLEGATVSADTADISSSAAIDPKVTKEPDTPKWAQAPTPRTTPETKEPEEPKWRQAPEPQKEPEPETSDEEEGRKDRTPLWARVLRPDDGSDDDLFPITIVRITRNSAGRIFFYTEGGQVWRQTQVRDVTPPKSLPASAVVQRSITGNPKLSFDDVPNRSYRVRRVE